MAIDGKAALQILDRIGNANAKGEYYLTDAVAIVRELGMEAAVIETGEDEVRGINTKAQLAEAEAVMQARLRKAALDAGVTLIAPETVFLSADTSFGRDVTIEPFVVIGAGVSIADGAVIHSFSHLVQSKVGKDASVGPYARLRPGTSLGDGAKIGNFVETKAAQIDAGAKVNHLTYIGDAHIGANANIGAGTITCNYDGFGKHKTEIGAGAFVGSNSSLVAPLKIGAGRLCRLGLGGHPRRSRGCACGGARPAGASRGLGQALSRGENAGQDAPGQIGSGARIGARVNVVLLRNDY